MTNTGKSFELKVKKCLEDEINNGDLGIIPKQAKVVHQKTYYSQERQSDIFMDVVIEIYRPNSDMPYLEWVWECKDYTNKVPIDDLEEFHAKLEQIGLHSKKGTIVCPNGFQKSAVTYAKNKGIGLVRLLPDGSLFRLQESIKNGTISYTLANQYLTQDSTEIFFNSSFFGLTSSGEGVNSLSVMILKEIGDLV